jgi:hypothetical protein
MINQKVNTMIKQAKLLKIAISEDIIDVQNAKHENLLNRNDDKLSLMTEITTSHSELNTLLSQAINDGIDIDQYRDIVDELEVHLRELYDLNGRLAAIVLPVKQMYKEIIDEITTSNGGSLIEVSV